MGRLRVLPLGLCAVAALTAACGSPAVPMSWLSGAPQAAMAVDWSLAPPIDLPDYQATLTRGPSGAVTGSWFDVKGLASDGTNLDAEDLARLQPGQQGLYDYLARQHGAVDLFVGGVGEERAGWGHPLACFASAPTFELDYSLDAYTGFGKSYWWPLSRSWQSSLIPFDGIAGIPHYAGSVQYGAYLLDRAIAKLEAAGADRIRILGHSKGSDVCANAADHPALGYSIARDPHVAEIWTFAMPFISPYSPTHWHVRSQAPHWGGFWRTPDGRVVIYNRDSDFTTYGGFGTLDHHDYTHLILDTPAGPYPGSRGDSPTWSPSENFLARMRRFSESDATSDQSPQTLSYDW